MGDAGIGGTNDENIVSLAWAKSGGRPMTGAESRRRVSGEEKKTRARIL